MPPTRMWIFVCFVMVMVGQPACDKTTPTSPTPVPTPTPSPTLRCGETPNGAPAISLFVRPFVGFYTLSNYFDHDRPLEFQDANGFQLTACGERVSAAGRVDGHSGYDWLMPSGTSLRAVADGEVIAVGPDPPFYCPTLGRAVQLGVRPFVTS